MVYSYRELVNVNSKIKFMDEQQNAMALLNYGKVLMWKGSQEAAQVFRQAHDKFKILHGASSDGKQIYDGFLQKIGQFMMQIQTSQ